jgi:hypothetical protein
MADLRLYKEIYRIDYTPNSTNYTLINPISISATVINRSDSSLIEIATVIQESTGVYYAILTPALYSYSYVYQVQWNITYTTGSPAKLLRTTFRFLQTNTFVLGNVVSDIEIDVDNSRIIEYGLDNSDEIIIHVK